MERVERKTTLISALAYTGISLALAVAFSAAAAALGSYNNVARYGGMVWVFLLSMIITMPIITSYFKRRFKRR